MLMGNKYLTILISVFYYRLPDVRLLSVGRISLMPGGILIAALTPFVRIGWTMGWYGPPTNVRYATDVGVL